MLNYLRNHLTAKILLITAAMLLVAAAVTYGFIAWYAPGQYLIAVEKSLSQEAESLVGEIGQANAEEAQKLLDQFGSRHSVTVTLKEAAGSEDSPETFPETYTLSVGDVSQAAVPFTAALRQVFLPLMAVVFVLALIVSAFYSRYITRPVIEISEASRKIASLDFDVSCKEGRGDELGKLAGNLNELSRCLSSALEEARLANILLKEDMAREKELEGQQLAFFSAVSHELKTPITILKGQLQGMLYGVGGYKDRDKYLKRAFDVTCAMENLVMEILTVSRMKSSGFALRMEEVLLADLTESILADYEELLLEKGIEVEMKTDSREKTAVRVDKRLFGKVISNLVSNACHYSPKGEKVRIRIFKTEVGVQLSVENTGVHIPENEIPGLFEPFTRREQSRNRETGGSGLGLFIVRKVLELHHFSYRLENTEDGVGFFIDLAK